MNAQKRSMLAVFLLVILFLGVHGALAEDYWMLEGQANVYSQHDTSSPIIAVAGGGTIYTIIDSTGINRWIKIAYSDQQTGIYTEGWINESLLESPPSLYPGAPIITEHQGDSRFANSTSLAVIDGKNSDRVHLRETASATAKSLGLYFTGTEVVYGSGSIGEWTCVVIADQTGWIKSEYLYFGSDASRIKPQQPSGVITNVKANSWANLRSGPHPSSEVVKKLYKDNTVTVLGETTTKWYYVNAGGTYGYISADFLAIDTSSQGTAWTGVIDGKTSDRVHLREAATSNSKSLGLYFTGTRVGCDTNSNAEWIWVTIGNESGYIKSEFLYRGSNPGGVKTKQLTGVVSNKSGSNWVNLRYNPLLDAGVASKLYNGDVVIILGETATNWYYVKAGDLHGYIMSGYVSTSDVNPATGAQPAPQNWKVQFEKNLFDMYEVIPSRYEPLTDGVYQVYVVLNGEEIPYVVVDPSTGNFHG